MTNDNNRLEKTVCARLSKHFRPIAIPRTDGSRRRWNHNARTVLLNLLAQIEILPELDACVWDDPDQYPATIRTIGIPYKPRAWFDKSLDTSRRQAYSRATRWLEQAGLVRRIMEPHRNRITHLRFTLEGLITALEIAGPGADRLTIAEGLQLTHWGRKLADKIRFEPRQDDPNASDQAAPQ
jgi:hypothetical protein